MILGSDDVALVTGGASGLGLATARALAETGATVVVVDLDRALTRSEGALSLSKGDRTSTGSARIVPVAADVRDEDQVQAAVAAATELGVLRAAVNCAGVATPGRVLGKRGLLPLETFRAVVEINLVGTFNVLRLAAEAMAANEPTDGDRGAVLMTASVAAYDGQIGQAAYAASKGGIVALTLTAARDLAQYGIRVMTIAPGVMETPMMAGLPNDVRSVLEAQVPHPPRLGRPEEYAQLVQAILANPLLNGEVIRLDGALRLPPR